MFVPNCRGVPQKGGCRFPRGPVAQRTAGKCTPCYRGAVWRALPAFVFATACSSTGAPPDAQPQQLHLDGVIADGKITLHTSESDLEAGCTGGDVFPQPGSTGYVDDVVTCRQGQLQSCLTHVALTVGGTTVGGTIDPGRAIAMNGLVTGALGGNLRIEGCGGVADVALPVAIAPQPSIGATVDTSARTISVSWSATPTAPSALLGVNTSLFTDLAHVTDSPYTFAVPTGVSVDLYRQATATTFGPPVEVATPFGTARIWTGASQSMLLQ